MSRFGRCADLPEGFLFQANNPWPSDDQPRLLGGRHHVRGNKHETTAPSIHKSVSSVHAIDYCFGSSSLGPYTAPQNRVQADLSGSCWSDSQVGKRAVGSGKPFTMAGCVASSRYVTFSRPVQFLKVYRVRISVDNTLSVLANSSASRGLPHNVTRNLTSVMRTASVSRSRRRFRWNPKLEATSKAYQPKSLASLQKDIEMQTFNDEAFGAFGEIIKMAEGRHEILLGNKH